LLKILISKGSLRFLKYTLVGASTFLFDLVLLLILTEKIGLGPTGGAGLAYFIAVSTNFWFSHKYVFSKTKSPRHKNYLSFMIISVVGVLLVISLMFVFVNIFSFNYLASRIIIAGITGFWNYLMNLYFNFKVVGQH